MRVVAWFASSASATATKGTYSDVLTVTKGTAAGIPITINFKIATVTDHAPELSDGEGNVNYVVDNVIYPGSKAKGVGQYCVYAEVKSGDTEKWVNSIVSRELSSEDFSFTLTAKAQDTENHKIGAKLLTDVADGGEDIDSDGHVIVVTMTSAGAFSIKSINGDDSLSTATALNVTGSDVYKTAAAAKFGLIPGYTTSKTADNYDTDNYPTDGKILTSLFDIAVTGA